MASLKIANMTTKSTAHGITKSSKSVHTDTMSLALAMVQPLDNQCINTHNAFGKDIGYPLVDTKHSPFIALPDLNELRVSLLKAINERGDIAGSYLFDGPDSVEDTQNLIRNITNPAYATAIPSMNPFFATLPGLEVEFADQFPDTMATTETTTIVIAPSDHFMELQHTNESYTYATLMTGQMIWIIWPPTRHNLDCLKAGYEMFEADRGSANEAIMSKLEYGVKFVQEKEQCVRLPPFCIVLALTTRTTVLAKTSVITGDSFVQALLNLPLLEAWWKTEEHGADKRFEFFSALAWQTPMIIDGDFEDYDPKSLEHPISMSGPLCLLLKAWDNFKANFLPMLNDQDEKDIMRRMVHLMKKCKGNRCLICGRSFGKSKSGMNVENHLRKLHWIEGRMEDSH